MVFSSLEFIFVFLASVLAVYYLVPPKARNIVLLLFSLVFYGWGEPVYVFLMIATITVDYICGYIIGRDLDSKPKRAKVTLIVSIVINLALLGVFKYYDFFAGTLNSLLGRGVFPTLGLTLPIGISFYTFQALSATRAFRRTSPHSAHTLRSFRSLSRDRSSATPTLTISCASARIR